MSIVCRVSSPLVGEREKTKAYAVLAFLTAILLASLLVPPVREPPLSVCLVHLVLGIAGPGCGMTRAFLFIGHGDLPAALTLNPNSVLAFGLIVVLWANRVARILRHRELSLVLSRRGRLGVYLVTAALTGLAWIYNLVANPWV